MFIGFFPPWLPKVIRRCVYKGNMAVSEHKLPVDGATSFGILLVVGTLLPSKNLTQEALKACRTLMGTLEEHGKLTELSVILPGRKEVKLQANADGKFSVKDLTPIMKRLDINSARFLKSVGRKSLRISPWCFQFFCGWFLGVWASSGFKRSSQQSVRTWPLGRSCRAFFDCVVVSSLLVSKIFYFDYPIHGLRWWKPISRRLFLRNVQTQLFRPEFTPSCSQVAGEVRKPWSSLSSSSSSQRGEDTSVARTWRVWRTWAWLLLAQGWGVEHVPSSQQEYLSKQLSSCKPKIVESWTSASTLLTCPTSMWPEHRLANCEPLRSLACVCVYKNSYYTVIYYWYRICDVNLSYYRGHIFCIYTYKLYM